MIRTEIQAGICGFRTSVEVAGSVALPAPIAISIERTG